MTSQEALAVLKKHANQLRARGILHAALFGSVARGEAGPNSDIDILIEIDPTLKLDMFAYAGLKRCVSELFAEPVDVVSKDALKPHLQQPIAADAVYAF